MVRIAPALLCLCSLSTGCASSLGWTWSQPEFLQAPEASKYDGKPAVYLLKRLRMLSSDDWRKPSYVEWQHHAVIAILNEEGFSYADVRVGYPREDADIVDFAARTVGPDGSVLDVEPSRIFDDEAKGDEDSGWKVRVFTFPNVTPGSILEYQYTVRLDRNQSFFSEYVDHKIPIERYEVELSGTKNIRYNVRAYNIPADAQWVTREEDGLWKLEWAMKDVPAVKSESHEPPRERTSPWWMYTVNAYQSPRSVRKVHVDWSETTKYRAKAFYEPEDYYDGFAPKLDYSKCSNRGCKIEVVLTFLRERLPYKYFSDSIGRKAKSVMDSGYSSNFEKARLAYELLRREGIVTKFALTNRREQQLVDDEQPHWNRLKHVVLWVEGKGGAERWLDPTCEFCAPGELPPWIRGERALILEGSRSGLSSVDEYAGTWKAVTGTFAPPTTWDRNLVLRVDAGGDLTLNVDEVTKGRAVQDERADTWGHKEEDWIKDGIDRAKSYAETALVSEDSHLVTSKDVRTSTRTMRLRVPGYATVDGERLLIPLSVANSSWDTNFEKKEREQDLFFTQDATSTDRLRLLVPQGYVVKALLEPTKVSSEVLDVTVTVEDRGDVVEVVRSLRMKVGVHDKEHYEAARAAVAAFRKVDKTVVILEAKPSSEPAPPDIAEKSP